MTFNEFLQGLLGVVFLTLILHVLVSRWYNGRFQSQTPKVWQRNKAKGLTALNQYGTRQEFQANDYTLNWLDQSSRHQYTYVEGRYTFRPTLYFIFIPLLCGYFYAIVKGYYPF